MTELNLVQTLDSQSRNMQIDVRIITLDDNLFHPYFTSADISKDNLSPIGTAIAIAPYSLDVLKYWNKYTGTVIFSFNMKELQHVNTNSAEFAKAYDLPQRLENDQYNYSFIGKISKIKHKGKKIIIYFEDLGWKFLQKVPMEFRNAYIAGQPLDKAFQAICEFLDVEFAYSIEDLQEYTFAADGYSVQKEGQTIEVVETILSEWKTQKEEEEENDPLDQKDYENPSLMEYDNKHKNDEDYVRNEKTNNKKIDESAQESEKNKEKEKNEENEKQQEEFDKKIINLFIGNTYYESNLTSNIMDYGKITVTPTATNTDSTNSSISTVSGNSGSSSNTSSTTGDDGISVQEYEKNIFDNAKTAVVLGSDLRFIRKSPSRF